MKAFVVFTLSALVLQVSCQGMFDLLDDFVKLRGIPQTLPKADSEGMSNIKNITTEMSDISKNLPESISIKLGSFINETTTTIANLPENITDTSLSIAIQGAKRALSGVEDNILAQLKESVGKVNNAVENLTLTATKSYTDAELKIQIAAHPMNEYLLSRIRFQDPETEVAICLNKVKTTFDGEVSVVDEKIHKCISEKVDQGKNATINIDNLIDESKKTIQKSIGMVRECVANLTSESSSDDNSKASSCLVTNSGKVVSKEFLASYQIATKTSTNLDQIKEAENSIPHCIPDGLIQNSFNFDAVKNATDACI